MLIHAPFEDTVEALNRVGMDAALANVFVLAMPYGAAGLLLRPVDPDG
jgi:hypothetical protein